MSLKVSEQKIVTLNFIPKEVEDFKVWREAARQEGKRVEFDRRNDIYCMNPTNDFEMYLNYCTFLNSKQSMWKNYGFFDMGMVPYLMWPSFMDNNPCLEQMRDLARGMNIDLIPTPPVTFLKSSYVCNGVDYWIFRDDLYNLAKEIQKRNPEYHFNINSPEDATLSKFLKPLADACRVLRMGGVK